MRGLSLLPAAARRRGLIERAVRWTLDSEKSKADGELVVAFVGRRRMLELNRRFLGHDHDTDVIAFRYEDFPPLGAETAFGDVFICVEQARAQARRLGHGVLTECLTLAAHGTLHLLGYDDDTARGKARMFRKQRLCLKALSARPKAGRPISN